MLLRLLPILLIAAPLSAATWEATPATIAATLIKAKPGDTIRLKGAFQRVYVPRRAWAPPITIDASSASMTGVDLIGVDGVKLKGGVIRQIVRQTDRVGGNGVTIRDSKNVSVVGVKIEGTLYGIRPVNSTDLQLIGNLLTGIGGDGIQGTGLQRVLIEGNICRDFRSVDTHAIHPDCVQIFPAKAGLPTRDIIVRSNTALGVMQGFFFKGEDGDGSGFDRMVVEKNYARITYANGVILTNARDSIVQRNQVSAVPGSVFKAPTFYPVKTSVKVTGERNKVCGNIMPDHPMALATMPC